MIRPGKKKTLEAAISLVPQYTQLLRDLQKGDGQLIFRADFAATQNRLGQYVQFYDDERRINVALLLAILGEEGYYKLCEELKNASLDEQQQFIDEIADNDNWQEHAESFQFSDTPQGRAEACKHFESLPAEEQRKVEKCNGLFWSYLFSSFFNTLALMVHGEKLTTLVPKAINGDDTAFMRALQTDRMLLQHHPYFKARKLRAQKESDKKFLLRIASREATPILSGQVQYPGLYMVFGILESFQWLDDLKAEEILDICIEAGLDQYQNRIDDVNYLRQQLNKYRKWQKLQRMSRI